MKLYDVSVVIGRFQVFHNSHLDLIMCASNFAHKVIIIVGSVNQQRCEENPFSFKERKSVIEESLKEVEISNYEIFGVEDTISDYKLWIKNVKSIVQENSLSTDKICLVGSRKDEKTSDYLNKFPDWDLEDFYQKSKLNASDIRKLYFKDFDLNYLVGVVPKFTLRFLENFRETSSYKDLQKEINYNVHMMTSELFQKINRADSITDEELEIGLIFFRALKENLEVLGVEYKIVTFHIRRYEEMLLAFKLARK